MAIATQIERLEQVITESLLNEWEAQGHSMTGKIVRDIEYKVKEETNRMILQGFMYPYGNIIAAGISESKIPYSGRTGRGGTSLYIQALQNYAKVRMGISDEKKSLSIAFAIATSQKKHGMPTPRSYNYSSTGKRRDWIEEALKNNEQRIMEVISEMSYNMLSVQLDAILAKWQVQLNTKE
jgi:hypothetical protein